MNYSIKTYQDGFIQPQFEIGSKLYDPWPMGGQTRPQQLEKAYTAENFDPETRFYLFSGETMVGFLTASLKEEKEGKKYFFFEFPYVLEEHQPKGEKLLLDHSIKALKDKGADVLVARAGDYWGNSLKYAIEYGFEKKQDIARRGVININEVGNTHFGDPSILEDFDTSKHIEPTAEAMAKRFNAPKENMIKNLSRWENTSMGDSTTSPWGQTLTFRSHKVLIENDEFVGRLLVMDHSNYPEDTINMSQLFFNEKLSKDQLGAFIQETVNTGRKLGKEKAVVHTGLWGTFPDDEPFTQFDIELEMKLAFYEKEL